jgi:hypothetical protein
MKRILCLCSAAIAAVVIATSACAQAVYIKVVPMESKRADQYAYRGTYSGAFDKNVEREEVFNVTIKNMAPESFEYTIEWMFLSSPAGGGGKITPFHIEDKKITLDKGAGTTFELRSPKLASTHSYDTYGSGHRFTGSKFAGYVLRVKYNDKVVGVDASDIQLKRKYEDPRAKWVVSDETDSKSSSSTHKKKPVVGNF